MSAHEHRSGGPGVPEPAPDLLRRLSARLAARVAVDVGGADGASVEVLLDAGWPRVHAASLDPLHASALAARFGADERVRVVDVALGPRDEPTTARLAGDRPRRETAPPGALAPPVPTRGRTLGSLVENGTLPAEVGILTVDAAGSDLGIVQGLGRLVAEAVVVAYRHAAPAAGRPRSLQEVADGLAARGYFHALVATRRDGFRILQLDAFVTRPGDEGSAIFVHDRAYPALAPFLREEIAHAQDRLLAAAVELRDLAERRLDIVAQLRSELDRVGRPRRLDPRLGFLRHHAPRPLEIPDRYRAEPAAARPPGISIVTVTLNAGRFLERTLRSVLDQGYGPLEYVVRDGGSTDDTPGILDRYRPRLAACAIEADGGQADALNRGFAHTSGEIMAYLNGDDLLLPGALHYVGRFFASHPAVDVVYGHRVLIDQDDAEIGRWVLPRHSRAVLAWADYVPQETLFWRRRIWERVGARLDDSFHFAMDWELLLRFRASGARFARVPRFIGAFRVHEDQKTSSRMADLGLREMARLHEREHGRRVTRAEVQRRVRGYLLRHMVYQKLYRIGVLSY